METYFENVLSSIVLAFGSSPAPTRRMPALTTGSVSIESWSFSSRRAFRPLDALRSATPLSASTLRLNGHGTIAPGARADLVVVNGHPTTDILATRNIVSVWKCGQQIDRQPRDKQ
jgi:imidazolonepropionase-like amidohydrolase